MKRLLQSAVVVLGVLVSGVQSATAQTGVSLFSGEDLSGWVNVIGAESEWTVEGEAIAAAGLIKSVLRTDEQHENYVLTFEYRRSASSGNAGIILHADALPAPGQPWPRGINVRLDAPDGGSAIAATGGAMIEPVPSRSAAAPTDGDWVQCRIESMDGHVKLRMNGDVVASANYASPRMGYIALKSNGAEVRFRDLRLESLGSTDPAPYEVAQKDRGYTSIYNGSDLSTHWEMKPGHRGHWTAQNWLIDYDGASEADDKSLWTRRAYGNFKLIADMRFTRKPETDSLPVVLPDGSDATDGEGNPIMVEVPYAGDTGIYVRGSSKNQINMGNRYIGSGEIYGYRVDESMPPEVRRGVVPRVKANNPPGEWNRYVITMDGDRISIELNGHVIIDDVRLPGIAETGKIALQDDHASGNRFQFGNLYVKELE